MRSYTPAQQEIFKAVRKMRVGAKLTQRELAAELKWPLYVIGKIEARRRRVDVMEWIAICRACGVDPVKASLTLLRSLEHGLAEDDR